MELRDRVNRLLLQLVSTPGKVWVVMDEEGWLRLIPHERVVGCYTREATADMIIEDVEAMLSHLKAHGRGG